MGEMVLIKTQQNAFVAGVKAEQEELAAYTLAIPSSEISSEAGERDEMYEHHDFLDTKVELPAAGVTRRWAPQAAIIVTMERTETEKEELIQRMMAAA